MTNKDRVKQMLKEFPAMRERNRKDEGLAVLAIRKVGIQELVRDGVISKETIIAMLQYYTTIDRVWRQVLERNDELRGDDYDEKAELERKKQLELGYDV